MPRSVEISQTVAKAINHTTWLIPRIRDGDTWRNIHNPNLIENPTHINGHDRFEQAISRIKTLMKSQGWQVSMTSEIEPCHEHLEYHHYRLLCRR